MDEEACKLGRCLEKLTFRFKGSSFWQKDKSRSKYQKIEQLHRGIMALW
jgi:predicted nucleic acid-binding Zn ribbon protein